MLAIYSCSLVGSAKQNMWRDITDSFGALLIYTSYFDGSKLEINVKLAQPCERPHLLGLDTTPTTTSSERKMRTIRFILPDKA